jgi:glycosyltransferase involved in cell wall biosynthesis
MNVIIIASGVDWEKGKLGISGGDRIFIELAKRLSKNNNVVIYGWEATRLMCDMHGVSNLFKDIGLISPFLYNNRILSYITRTIKSTSFICKDIKDYKREKTVIISASDFWPDTIPAYFLSLFYKYKWASSLYLIAPSVFLSTGSHTGLKRIIALFYKLSQFISISLIRANSSLLLTCSQDVINKVNSNKNHFLNQFFLYGGVTIDDEVLKLRKLNIRNPQYDVVYMARFHPQKGPIEMVKIWNEVVRINPTLRLAMIGDGPLESEVKRLIEQLGIDQSVDLLGFIDGKEKNKIFINSKIFAHSVIYDTGGMAAMEAMVLGIPAIAFDLKGLRDAYPKGMHKIKCYNIDEFAQSIIEILNDKEYYNKLKNDAINLSNDWDWNIHAHNLQNELECLFKNSKTI